MSGFPFIIDVLIHVVLIILILNGGHCHLMHFALYDPRVQQLVPDALRDVLAEFVGIDLACASTPAHQLNLSLATHSSQSQTVLQHHGVGQESSWFLHLSGAMLIAGQYFGKSFHSKTYRFVCRFCGYSIVLAVQRPIH